MNNLKKKYRDESINIKTFDKYFYKNCKRNRRAKAKICQVCPFKKERKSSDKIRKIIDETIEEVQK